MLPIKTHHSRSLAGAALLKAPEIFPCPAPPHMQNEDMSHAGFAKKFGKAEQDLFLSASCKKIKLALWCNGNTVPFGGIIHGSSPCGAATLIK